jgi:hypothetical protein
LFSKITIKLNISNMNNPFELHNFKNMYNKIVDEFEFEKEWIIGIRMRHTNHVYDCIFRFRMLVENVII